jgi:hypothetical protein
MDSEGKEEGTETRKDFNRRVRELRGLLIDRFEAPSTQPSSILETQVTDGPLAVVDEPVLH